MTARSLLGLISLVCLAPATGSAQEDTPPTPKSSAGRRAPARSSSTWTTSACRGDTELGTIEAIEKGVANSLSVMMPTPWVPHAVEWIKATRADAGLHLTLTSEWKLYRWGPLAGKPAVPGLVDPQGALWPNVASVVKNATPDEVEREIRAQLDRARTMGFEPTHFDSHMGTLFATPEPSSSATSRSGSSSRSRSCSPAGTTSIWRRARRRAPRARARSASGSGPAGCPCSTTSTTTATAGRPKTRWTCYIDAVRGLKPGVTMMIMHCTRPTEVFAQISSSGTVRLGDLKAMLDPRLRKALAGRAHRPHDLARADGAAEGCLAIHR